MDNGEAKRAGLSHIIVSSSALMLVPHKRNILDVFAICQNDILFLFGVTQLPHDKREDNICLGFHSCQALICLTADLHVTVPSVQRHSNISSELQ